MIPVINARFISTLVSSPIPARGSRFCDSRNDALVVAAGRPTYTSSSLGSFGQSSGGGIDTDLFGCRALRGDATAEGLVNFIEAHFGPDRYGFEVRVVYVASGRRVPAGDEIRKYRVED